MYNPSMAKPGTTQASERRKVFISHASADADLARRVADVLKASGFQAWEDSQVLPGDNWGEKLAESLRESDAMVVLLTPHSLHSPNINYEVGYALGNEDYKGRLIPVVAGPPEQFPVEDIPWILSKFNMIRLPDDDEEGLKKIAQALRESA